MKAIFVTGGKQYCVSEGDVVYVEKLDAKEGSTVTLDKVLMIDDKIGKPYLAGASVECEVQKQGKQEKSKACKGKSEHYVH